MKVITDVAELVGLVLISVLIVAAVCAMVSFYIRRRKRKQQLERQQKRDALAAELCQMSDLSLKLWYSSYRRGNFSEEYNAPDMRQIIEDEMRRRKFSLYFRS